MVVIEKPSDLTVLSVSRGENFSPLSIGVADRVVARVLAEKGWDVDLRTVATFDALPADVKNAVAEYGEDGSSGKVQGVLHKGVLHVVADAHGSEADLESTILHEMVGHIGVRRLYNRGVTAMLNRLCSFKNLSLSAMLIPFVLALRQYPLPDGSHAIASFNGTLRVIKVCILGKWRSFSVVPNEFHY